MRNGLWQAYCLLTLPSSSTPFQRRISQDFPKSSPLPAPLPSQDFAGYSSQRVGSSQKTFVAKGKMAAWSGTMQLAGMAGSASLRRSSGQQILLYFAADLSFATVEGIASCSNGKTTGSPLRRPCLGLSALSKYLSVLSRRNKMMHEETFVNLTELHKCKNSGT